jgi:hypothetical protein
MANVSKISIIKDSNSQCEETISSNHESNSTKSFIRDTMQKIEDTSSPISNGDNQKQDGSVNGGEFVRGDPKARLSQKNIKQMFKNVVKYQMSALDSLEKFYENHVEKLEIDRDAALSAHQESKEKINQFFDSQLKLLEQRVQTNLKFICENKSNSNNKFSTTTFVSSKNNSSTELNKNSANILNHKLSQIMLLKKMQAHTSNDEVLGQLTRSRNLIGLKSSLINQNNILPSLINKSHLIRQSTNKGDLNSMLFKENSFKRNISSRNTIVNIENRDVNNEIISPRKMQTHSTSRIDYNSEEQTGFANFSPFQLMDFNQLNQSKMNLNLKSQFQYQKNVGLRKNYSSNESISKMVRSASIETFNDSQLLKLTNSNSDEKVVKVENVNSSTYSKIKRQNKSASSSLKVEEFNTPDGLSGLNQEDYMNHFRLNYSRNSSIYNSSMRNTSILNGTFGESNHLVKYLPPRFSDAHIHLKLNQQKLAASRNELKYLNQRYLSQLQHMPKVLTESDRSSLKLVKPLETSV